MRGSLNTREKQGHMKGQREGSHLQNGVGGVCFLKMEREDVFKMHSYISRIKYNF